MRASLKTPRSHKGAAAALVGMCVAVTLGALSFGGASAWASASGMEIDEGASGAAALSGSPPSDEGALGDTKGADAPDAAGGGSDETQEPEGGAASQEVAPPPASSDSGAKEAEGSSADPASNEAHLSLGPWFAQHDDAARERAQRTAQQQREAEANVQAVLVAGCAAALAVMCAASGAACLIAARSAGSYRSGTQKTYGHNEKQVVTKRRKLDVGI